MSFRAIPSIEQLRQRSDVQELERAFGRERVVEALRAEAAAVRTRIAGGEAPADPAGDIAARLPDRLGESLYSLEPVINATGVIIHTNLGRAPLSHPAAERVATLSRGYTNLEYDPSRGVRGRRDVHAEGLLCRLTGAEAAVVVNNNAAATLLTLAALASGREVVISRGELVEIGGGFRVPDVMAQSGAVLREVGTTNRTRAADYGAAISDRTALILRVHPSNFRVEGFTERPSLGDLVALGRRFNVPVAEDLGSGYLGVPENVEALGDEPIVRASLDAGADVVMFSGDKLLGGPQAGIIAGRESALTPIRRHPLMRALRVDKLTYAALEGTLESYASGRAASEVPVARMIAMPVSEIDRRARALVAALASGLRVELVDGYSTIGGGSAPGSSIATRLIAVTHSGIPSDALAAALRRHVPPVIARIENDKVLLDLRTVAPEDDERLLDALAAMSGSQRSSR
jgi:L-seryl-tRNA(Ser) seleniumtransferase